ncbi:MAG: carboxypeptidase regulatory-like domain-containing protein [Kofleriaceae bacterium]
MQRRVGVAIGLVGISAALVLWLWWGRRGGEPGAAGPGSAQVARKDAPSTAGRARPDPKTLARGSIAGTVTGEAGTPVADARVCARGASNELPSHLLRDPACATTNAQGHYRIADLLPASYRATAGAPTYRPGDHHASRDRGHPNIQLAPGEHKTGIDIALAPGGVEITGVVSDVTGGAVGHARISASPARWSMATNGAVSGEADDHGKFSLWVAPGAVMVVASADGYADAELYGAAPGQFEVLLTPESSLSGVVVDAATGAPIANARVSAEQADLWARSGEVFSDAAGAFRFDRLEPGRIELTAHTAGGYGRSEGSTRVGLGQHVDGVVVKLFPAHRIEAQIVISTTRQRCTESPQATLRDRANRREVWTRAEPDGRLWIDGVLPGTYQVEVSCASHVARETYEPVVVADRDVAVSWEVDLGASIRGTVKTAAGAPVEGAMVLAHTGGKTARARSSSATDQSRTDGSYELTGLAAGSYRIDVSTHEGVAPSEGYAIEVADGAAAIRDLVLEEVGAIQGTVVDSTGAPMSGVDLQVVAANGTFRPLGFMRGQRTDATGAFRVTGQRPGSYRVVASLGWGEQLRKPGTNDDAKQGELVEVRAGQTATVKLVVEARSGTITGVVVDAGGKPVADAFVSAARESDRAGALGSSVSQTRWTWNERPVVTSTEGAFSIGKLSPGNYTVRAYRRGGGEAVAEHVAIGATARLQIKATGSISGTVTRAGGEPIALSIQIASAEAGFTRSEQFYRTGGRYTVQDLPSGTFRITAEAEGGRGELELELAEGAQRTGVDLALASLVTVRGRIVEHGTGKPVPGIRVFAAPASGGVGGFEFSSAGKQDNISDDTGAFTLEHVARGQVALRGFPKNFGASDYHRLDLVRTIGGTGATFDVGDLPILRKRIKDGEPIGELGIHFAQQPPGTPPEQRKLEVSYIDPAGPAARTELKVGDVITAIDGLDVTGANRGQASVLLRAAPGTQIALALQRGATVTVVLAAP